MPVKANSSWQAFYGSQPVNIYFAQLKTIFTGIISEYFVQLN